MQTPFREVSLISSQWLYQLAGKSAWFSCLRVPKQKVNIFKAGKPWYEPAITMFHGGSSQESSPLTLGSNTDLLVGNLPVIHHSPPKGREEVRVTMLLWNASQKKVSVNPFGCCQKELSGKKLTFCVESSSFHTVCLDRHLTFHCEFWMLRCWYGWQHVSVFTLKVITVML